MDNDPTTGILTFLFTDLEDSTSLWEQFPDVMPSALKRHDAILEQAVQSHRGRMVKTTGDGLHAVFESPAEGLAAALDGQLALAREAWPEETGPLKVRMGLHSGESQARAGDFYGSQVNLAARVMGLGHGGQVLLSDLTAGLVRHRLPQGCTLSDLGEHRLRGLSTPVTIHQLHHPDLADNFPALKSLAAFRHNLPHQLSSFVGREKELAEVQRRLADTRLLTLLGPGGTGKTRLMLQVAEEVIPGYPDGVWLVELAPLTDPDLIAGRVAAVLRVQEQPGRPLLGSLTDYLRRKEALLLLDNVEHVVREAAVFSEHLLAQCPRLTILATGREALFIDGETTIQVPSLSLPTTIESAANLDNLKACEAIQLFIERARALRPEFSLTTGNARALVEVVRRLDGIPLALELAAARMRMLTVEKIAERLNDRFRLLTGGSRTALPRQQTLEALIDWSWQLLEPDEQVLLQRLSVFAGGWDLEAAEQICGFDPLDPYHVLDLLDQLINKSMVTVEYPPDGEPRYGMLESIRQYTQERLFTAGEGQTLRDRHADYYVAFTQAAEEELDKKDAMTWVRRLRQELDNLRAVLAWTLDERPEQALRLTGHLRYNQAYWLAAREAEAWLSSVITKFRSLKDEGDIPIDPGDYIKALIAYGHTLVGLGHNREIGKYLPEAVALAREHGLDRLLVAAIGVNEIAHLFHIDQVNFQRIEEAIRICREQGYQPELAWNLGLLGGIYYLAGDIAKGAPYIEEAYQIRLALGSPREIATVNDTRGAMAWILRDWDKALALTRQSITLYEELGARHNVTRSQSRLGHIHRAMGNLDEAESIYRRTIAAWQELGNLPAVAHQVECFAYLAIGREDYELGARLVGAAKAARDRLKAASLSPLEIADMQQAMAQLAKAMNEEMRDRIIAEGAHLSLDEGVALALSDES